MFQTCVKNWKRFQTHGGNFFASREQRESLLSLCRGAAKNRRMKFSKEKFHAAIAQLVEHDLAKVGVASSSLVCRSKVDLWFILKCPGGGIGRRARFRCVCREVCRFESCSGHFSGEMAELVDALLWGGSDNYVVWVRVSFSSPKFIDISGNRFAPAYPNARRQWSHKPRAEGKLAFIMPRRRRPSLQEKFPKKFFLRQ